MIDERAVRGRALVPHREFTRPRPDRAERVGLRPVQRAHRDARQPGRGRAARPARHVPELAVRGPPAAVRGGGLRLPRHRADRHQRDERQDHPAAGQRRAVRHQVRHRPLAHPHPRPARGHPDQGGHVDLAGRAHRQGQVGAAGLADPARHRGDQLQGHAGELGERRKSRRRPATSRCASWSCRRSSRTRRSRSPRPTRAPPRSWKSRWSARSTTPSTATTRAPILVHGTRSSKLRLAAGMTHKVYGPARMATLHGVVRRPRAAARRRRGAAG